MNDRLNVVVLGAGWRVNTDVLPSLEALGVAADQITVVRKRPQETIRESRIRVCSIETVPSHVLDGSVVISCIPPRENRKALPALMRLGQPRVILVDTPIAAIAHDLVAIEWLYRVPIRILEDSILIPWLEVLRSNGCHAGVFYRAMYYNHGTALASALSSGRLFRVSPWPLSRLNVIVLMSTRMNVFLMLGPKSSERASATLLTTRMRRMSPAGISRVAASTFEAFRVARGSLDLGRIKPDSFHDPFRSIDDWKRVGLALGLESIFQDDLDNFPTISEALTYERLAGQDSSSLMARGLAIRATAWAKRYPQIRWAASLAKALVRQATEKR